MSDLMEQVFEDVRAERARQDERWGKQMHTNGTSPKFKPMADSARNSCRRADAQDANTWMHIMRGEVWEAFSETDRDRLRAELIQVIAVGTAWIECLDEQAASR